MELKASRAGPEAGSRQFSATPRERYRLVGPPRSRARVRIGSGGLLEIGEGLNDCGDGALFHGAQFPALDANLGAAEFCWAASNH